MSEASLWQRFLWYWSPWELRKQIVSEVEYLEGLLEDERKEHLAEVTLLRDHIAKLEGKDKVPEDACNECWGKDNYHCLTCDDICRRK